MPPKSNKIKFIKAELFLAFGIECQILRFCGNAVAEEKCALKKVNLLN